jgi:hypothetical protein
MRRRISGASMTSPAYSTTNSPLAIGRAARTPWPRLFVVRNTSIGYVGWGWGVGRDWVAMGGLEGRPPRRLP